MNRLDYPTLAILATTIFLLFLLLCIIMTIRILIFVKLKKESTKVTIKESLNNIKEKYQIPTLKAKLSFFKWGILLRFNSKKNTLKLTKKELESTNMYSHFILATATAIIVDYHQKQNELSWKLKGIVFGLLFAIVLVTLSTLMAIIGSTMPQQELYVIQAFCIGTWTIILMSWLWWASIMDVKKGYIIELLKVSGIEKQDLLKTKLILKLCWAIPFSIPLLV